ncbi:MAG: regulatory protein RecX [Evtepia sp.]
MSAGQLNEKLMAKGATERQAAETVAWAVEIGLVNDAEYAKALVRHYQAKGYGLYKIKNELYRRRVPKAYWEDALAEMDDAEDTIDAFLAKKLRDPEDRKECKKALRRLSASRLFLVSDRRRHRAAEISNRLTQT